MKHYKSIGLALCSMLLVAACADQGVGKRGFRLTNERIHNRSITSAFYKNVSMSSMVDTIEMLLKKKNYYIKSKVSSPIGLIYAYKNTCNSQIDSNNCMMGSFSHPIIPTTRTVNTIMFGDPDIEAVPTFGMADSQNYNLRINQISRSDMIVSAIVTQMPEQSVRVRLVFQHVAYYAKGIQAASCNIVSDQCMPGAYPDIYEEFFKEIDNNIVSDQCMPGAYPDIYEEFFKEIDNQLDQTHTSSSS